MLMRDKSRSYACSLPPCLISLPESSTSSSYTRLEIQEDGGYARHYWVYWPGNYGPTYGS
jgi:hypothetical protein